MLVFTVLYLQSNGKEDSMIRSCIESIGGIGFVALGAGILVLIKNLMPHEAPMTSGISPECRPSEPPKSHFLLDTGIVVATLAVIVFAVSTLTR
ncbi:MAG: hypothetical protein A2898_01160 [Candidatus Kerfeldbacteria bacterium RIFCSPLOWO2_01_FULL_48_11]|uniref:Uncharacterized protein n=1 Tax=Candidatus Kerfeldbacteria bacterium RIFCSPLOWO2_01_FULL_48_11 TaxID=1798543 RepID=A0A1G2B6B8_9BACT|nr:MAG: hypothetical protein UY52_C0004G0030 [Parcubacteria group bacterium GW2011_GWC2_49_9]OGY84692.1 MAG: hypothetical protein A2898_01160 [Candidatus Kerfeldbacteria bacterium RIFCSPLOWO2_01_FULL_48_11]